MAADRAAPRDIQISADLIADGITANGVGAGDAGDAGDAGSDGVAVCDGFLPTAQVAELVACAKDRRRRGEFSPGRIGTGARLQRRQEVRGDSTCWLDEPLFEAERSLAADLETLRLTLNRRAFLGLFEPELHYAWYPPGAGYDPHVDQPAGRNGRRVSLVLYLNQVWQPGDGGELRMFGAAGHWDIEPKAGRLVCFLTDGRPHAVLPTRADRLSITGWFRERNPV